MNRVYRLKFSNVLQQMIAVSEISRGHDRNSGKANSSRISAKLIKPSLLALLITVSLSSYSLASGLQGMEVISGSAEIKKEGVITTIKNSPDTVLNWQTFDIAKDETVHFAQENSKSTAFNKVIGEKPSDLQGKLTSNGNVFLINPNGIVIGKDAVIDTNSFIGSTLNTSNEELKNNKFTLSSENQKNRAGIVNHGKVKVSQKGSVTLIGNSVKNNGIIEAKEGNVLLQAGSKIELSDISNPSITYSITNFGQDVMNVGDVISNNVTLSGFNVSNDGNINISNLDNSQGSITINAKNEFNLNGKLDSSNKKGKANNIKINSPVSNINGIIDLSGRTEGGNVILGGKVNLSENSTINTSAIDTGNAGNITFSGTISRLDGKIKATGGSSAGSGGYLDTKNLPKISEKNIDLSAPNGNVGGVTLTRNSLTVISDESYQRQMERGYDVSDYIPVSSFNRTPNLTIKNTKFYIDYNAKSLNRIGNLTFDNVSYIYGNSFNWDAWKLHLNGNLFVRNSNIDGFSSQMDINGDLTVDNSYLKTNILGNINFANISKSNVELSRVNGGAKRGKIDNLIVHDSNLSTLSDINELTAYNSNVSTSFYNDKITLNNSSLSSSATIKSINAHNSYLKGRKDEGSIEKLTFTTDKDIENFIPPKDFYGNTQACSYNFSEYYCLNNLNVKELDINGIKIESNDYMLVNSDYGITTRERKLKELLRNKVQQEGEIALNIDGKSDLAVKINGNLIAGEITSEGNLHFVANDIGNENFNKENNKEGVSHFVGISSKGDLNLFSYGNVSASISGNNIYANVANDFLKSSIGSKNTVEITSKRFFSPSYIGANKLKLKTDEIPLALNFRAGSSKVDYIDIYSKKLNLMNTDEASYLYSSYLTRLYGSGLDDNSQGIDKNSQNKINSLGNIYIFSDDISEKNKNSILSDPDSNVIGYSKKNTTIYDPDSGAAIRTEGSKICVNSVCRDGSIIEDSGFGEMKEITDPFYKEPTPVDIPTEDPVSEDIPTEEPVSEDIPTEEPVSEEVPTEEPVSEEVPAEEPVSEDTPTEEPVSEDIPTEEPVSEDIPTEKNASKDTLFEEYEWIIPRVDGYGSNKNKERAIEYTKREEEFYNSIKNITDEKKRNELIKENKEYIERIKRHNIEYGRILGKALAYKNSAQSYKSGRELDSIQLFKDVADYGRQITFTVIPAVAAPATVVKAVAYDTAKKVIINGAFYYDESKESKESIEAKKLAKVVTEYGISTIEIIRDAEALHKVRNLKNTNSVLGGVISFAFDAYSDKIQSGIDYLENINKPKTNESTPYIMSHCKEASCRNSYEEEFNLAFSNGFKEALTEMDKDKKEYENAGFFHQVFNSKPETKYQNKADELLLELNVHVKETRKIVDDRMNEINSKK